MENLVFDNTKHKTVQDFFNKATKAIRSKYFPEVKYYRDNEDCAKIHYALELFSNGVTSYVETVNFIAQRVHDTPQNVHEILREFFEPKLRANFE